MKNSIIAVVVTLLIALAAPVTAEEALVPQFELQTAAGESVAIPADLEGPAIVLFWATWCPYCKALMPHLQSMLDEYRPALDLPVYAITIREDGDPAAYLASQGFDFVLLPDGDAVADEYGIRFTPSLWVVDGDGTVVYDLSEHRTLPAAREAGLEDLGNREKAARRAPWWAAQIRQALDGLGE